MRWFPQNEQVGHGSVSGSTCASKPVQCVLHMLCAAMVTALEDSYLYTRQAIMG